MFTGIIEEIGVIEKISKKGGGIRLIISAQRSSRDLRVNNSIAINGVCQTVINKKGNTFEVEAVEETLKKTTFGDLNNNDEINLELPMRLNERLGGHLVMGHVDCTGKIVQIKRRKNSLMVTIRFPKEYLKYVIPVGSIAVDGVSLTIAELFDNELTVSIISHTMKNTIFKNYKVNHDVNLEFDIVGKFIERIQNEGNTNQSKLKSKLTEKKLKQAGY